jgi:hypothetical protein
VALLHHLACCHMWYYSYMLKCPDCLEKVNHVYATRTIENDTCVRRHHICYSCNYRWTTYEDYSPAAKERLQSAITEKDKKVKLEPVTSAGDLKAANALLRKQLESMKLPVVPVAASGAPKDLSEFLDKLIE